MVCEPRRQISREDVFRIPEKTYKYTVSFLKIKKIRLLIQLSVATVYNRLKQILEPDFFNHKYNFITKKKINKKKQNIEWYVLTLYVLT